MIGFLQKHKKYLTVVVWISTFAFVAAGFVGWGSFTFSNTSSAVAIVGEREITAQQMQREYAKLYNMYNQIFNGGLDDEQAKNIGIQDQALNTLISRALMLNYAYDLGLRVSHDEIIQAIIGMDVFQSDGKFDEGLYKTLLAENQMRPKDFEEELKDSLLLQKLDALLNIPLTPLEMQAMSGSVFAKDHVSIQTIHESAIVFTPTKEGIQKYWEENKDIYQTQRGYEVSMVRITSEGFTAEEEVLKKYYEDFKNQFLDANGQLLSFEKAKDLVLEHYKASQAEKESLKEYIALRKGENKNAQTTTIFEGDSNYTTDFFNALSLAKEQETLKPIATQDGFITLKVLRIIPSEPKSFLEAKADATEDFIALEKTKLLAEKAKALLADFKGKDIGYVGRNHTQSIAGLNAQESEEFIRQLFSRSEAKGYILLKETAILYEILDQRLQNYDIITKNLDFLKRNGEQVKSRLIETAFMDFLLKTYKVVKKN